MSRPPSTDRRTSPGKALAIIPLVLVAAACLLFGGWWFFSGAGAEEPLELVTTTVFSGPYEHVITEQGTVENANSIELQCEVKSRGGSGGGSTIISVLPEGTQVQPGDVVVQLDASGLEQERLTQLIVVAGQKALLAQAENNLSAAQIARREYEKGTFSAEESLLIADEYVAQKTLSTAESSLEQAKRLYSRAIVTMKQVEAADFAVQDAKNRHAAIQTKLRSLREHTREKMLKTFDSAIATAMADVSAQRAKLSLEELKLKEIEDQIAKCTIRAPVAGEVVHANEFDSNNGVIEADFLVQAGAIVRERQPIVRLPSSTDMQVRASVSQARVTRVRPGMPVTIRIDALKEDAIRGEVVKINPYPDPAGWSSGNIKKYATFVKVFDPPPGFKSGMNAEVRIHIEQKPEALQIPVQALAQHQGRYFSLVQTSHTYETREVAIGSTNDKVATIESGLEEGDIVVMSPRRAAHLLELPPLGSREPSTVAGTPRPTPNTAAHSGKKRDPGGPAEPAGGE
jgi:RND family efflux transporter MFP subunit